MGKPRLLYNFYIKDKNGNKIKFPPKKAQIDFLKRRTGRDFVLKARQLGFTTLEQLRKLERAMLEPNITVATVAHKKIKTQEIFKMAKFAWDNLPEAIKGLYGVKYDNIRELDFSEMGSRYFVDLETRSGTVMDLHVSELAFIKDLDSLFASTLESVPKNGSITLETTANGLNRAHDLWQETVEGRNEFTPFFYNWTWEDDYEEIPPEDSSWKEHYKDLAKKYNLIVDIQNDFQLSDTKFYWYYLKAVRLKERTKQEYPTIPEEAFLASSISVFDLFQVAQLKASSAIRTVDGVAIFYEPVADHRYIVGVDTAEGQQSDFTSIEVWDVTDANNIIQVATYEDSTIRPDQTAKVSANIGYLYNTAFIIPERNSSGLSTVLKLQELNYPNLFVNTTIDKQTQMEKNEFGWRTMAGNRDVMIDDFVELFEEGKLTINALHTIQQMKTFVRKKNGRREHDDGYHDDSLFASFLAIQGMKYARDKTPSLYSAEGLPI